MAENADKRIDTKGFVLTHSDENNATKGFCSSEYTTTGYRPYVRIDYTNPTTAPTLLEYEIEIPLGEDYPIIVNNEIGTPTYTSANDLIASVDGGGTVCGNNAGSTTIAVNVDGYTLYCAVHVYRDNGIYRIASNYESGYLSFSTCDLNGNAIAGTYEHSSAAVENLTQFWKLTYIGSGFYTLRPWHNLNYVLCRDLVYNNLKLSMYPQDTDIPTFYKWSIEYTDDGYVIRNQSTSAALAANGTLNSSVYLDIYDPDDGVFYWSITQAPLPPNAALLYDSDTGKLISSNYGGGATNKYVPRSSTQTLDSMGLELYVCNRTTIAPVITWESSNSTTASVDASTGAVFGYNRGLAAITATVRINGANYYVPYSIPIVRMITVKNYYDSTISYSSTLASQMESAVEYANSIYTSNFFVHFEVSGTPTFFINSAFSCSLGNDVACDHRCNIVCLQHHKNVQRLSELFYTGYPRADDEINVFWSNASTAYCRFEYGLHTAENEVGRYCACVVGHRPIIQFCYLPQNDTDFPLQAYMSITLAHELAHTLGLDDAYDDEGHDTKDGYGCVMEGFDPENILEFYRSTRTNPNEAFCEDCIAGIEELIDLAILFGNEE